MLGATEDIEADRSKKKDRAAYHASQHRKYAHAHKVK